MAKKIMIISGEPSGDLHGANLAQSLKDLDNDIRLFGIGGERMRNNGVEIYWDIKDLAILGLVDVVIRYRKLRHIQKDLLGLLRSETPDAIVLIDYPDFNLRFAKRAFNFGIPILYYIPPQLWAWRKGRIKQIKRFIDKVIVIFRFEEDIYKDFNIPVHYVGHPLLDIVKPGLSRSEFIKGLKGLNQAEGIIAILPGSRKKEIKTLLPILSRTAELIYKEFPQFKFLISKSDLVEESMYEHILKKYSFPRWLIKNHTYEIIDTCELALVASGTVTLEAAILKKPMIITYKINLLEYLLVKPLMLLKDIGLVNVIAKKRIVPEFLQFDAKPELIAKKAISLLTNKEEYNRIKQALNQIEDALYPKGASKKAAEIILDHLSGKNS